MPRQTQTYPRGLIDLLQLKDSGRFDIEDNYRAVLEVIDILGSDRITTLNQTTATVVSGSTSFSNPMTVPEGQIWVMVSVGGELVLPVVGDIGQTWLGVRRLGRTSANLVVSPKQTATLANELVPFGFAYPRPLIMSGGDFLVQRCMYSGAGTATAQFRAEYYRFGPASLGSAL